MSKAAEKLFIAEQHSALQKLHLKKLFSKTCHLMQQKWMLLYQYQSL